MTQILNAEPQHLALACEYLKAGKLVGLPTETVYGLAADAANPKAVRKIFIAKNRPQTHPLIVHIGKIEQLNEWAIEIPEIAYQLAKAFWPGPLTLILKKHPDVDSIITGGQETIGIRMPAHPMTLSILEAGHLAVAAPSANQHCHISPTSAADVLEELGDQVDLVIDGGPCQVGIESTILNLISETPTILRPGMLSSADISQVIGQAVNNQTANDSTPRVSGMLEKHYAPQKPAYLMPLTALLEKMHEYPNAMVMALSKKPADFKGEWHQMPKAPEDYARELYKTLRAFDHSDHDILLIETPFNIGPSSSPWRPLIERLEKAAQIQVD